jgi:hypothetical protein
LVQGGSRELRVIPRKRVVGKVGDIGPRFHDSEMGIKVGYMIIFVMPVCKVLRENILSQAHFSASGKGHPSAFR